MPVFLLLRGTPESKAESTARKSFDWAGLIAFIVTMVALNIVIGQGAALGWVSPTVVVLIVVFLVSVIVFFKIETGNPNGFVDLTLFSDERSAAQPCRIVCSMEPPERCWWC